MLKQGNKTLMWVLIIFLFNFYSCSNENSKTFDYKIYDDYKQNHFNDHNQIYLIAHDSIQNWIKSGIKESFYIMFSRWQVDSTMIFNNDSSRLYTTLNKQKTAIKNGTQDVVMELLGAKINDRWYFYPGATYIVPRQNYQDSMYAPLTFEELSYVAHKRPMAGMLLRDKDGKVVVNHERMNDRFFAGDGDFHKCNKVQSCYDSVIIEINKSMHSKKLDPAEVEDIKSSMASSVRPEEPFLPSRVKKEKSWWDRLTQKDPEVKIFESEEWKNRHKRNR